MYNPKTRDVEARVIEKVRIYGADAIMYFDQSEFTYYSTIVEPALLLQMRANIENSIKSIN
jgi:hypothetical protein